MPSKKISLTNRQNYTCTALNCTIFSHCTSKYCTIFLIMSTDSNNELSPCSRTKAQANDLNEAKYSKKAYSVLYQQLQSRTIAFYVETVVLLERPGTPPTESDLKLFNQARSCSPADWRDLAVNRIYEALWGFFFRKRI